jgi:hypothetical protein
MAAIDLDCGFDGVIESRVNEIFGIWPFGVIRKADGVGACGEDRKGGLP